LSHRFEQADVLGKDCSVQERHVTSQCGEMPAVLIAAYFLGGLDEGVGARIVSHLRNCGDCLEKFRALRLAIEIHASRTMAPHDPASRGG
jgi:hypothetical protein